MGEGFLNSGTLTLEDSTVTNNQVSEAQFVGAGGGGINNHPNGTMTISSSTISGNTSEKNGGVYNQGVMLITNSTINDNTAAQGGGGIFNEDHLTMINSTVSGNYGGGSEGVGGIFAMGNNLAIANSTIVHNTGTVRGGVYIFGNTNTLIKNSIVALNSPMDCWGLSTASVLDILGSNLESASTCNGFTIHADPLIGPLADNGGQTWTHALLPTSPALDAVTDCTDPFGILVNVDQRYGLRPGGAACDIGAYEETTFGYQIPESETGEDDFLNNKIQPLLQHRKAQVWTAVPYLMTWISQ